MRRSYNLKLALALGLTILAGIGNARAQVKKPAPTKPAAAKPVNGPVVLGTTQLPGDFGKLGTTYTIGQANPLNFTLRSAEYTIAPVVVGGNTWVPKADQKLLILHYTVHNPVAREQNFDWSTVNFTAVDAQDKNQEMIQAAGRDGTTDSLSIRLKPAQKIDGVAAILVPAEGVVPKLIVAREKGASVIRYDLRGKVTSLPAAIADAADTSRATARKEVPAKAGTFYAMGVFEARMEEVTYVTSPLLGQEPGDGKRYLTATFTLKNRTNQKQSFYWGNFRAELVDAEGEKVPYTEALLKATRDERNEGDLAPGEEARVRLFFPLPDKVSGKTLRLAEGKEVDAREARVFAFDVSGK